MLRRLTSARIRHTLLITASLVVSLTPVYAQSARVLVQTGNVNYIKDSSGYTFALMDKTVLMPGYTVKTGSDGYAKFQVPDGSTFEVFPNSEVVYTKTESLPDLLNVWLGRVKVMIQHLPGVPNPNRVTTPTALISVRGTVFDVDVEDMDGTTVVALDQGIVDVKHRLKPGNPVQLFPGQLIRVYPNQPLARLSDTGGKLHNALKVVERAVYDALYSRPGGTSTGGGGNIPTNGGHQGDNGSGKTTTGNNGNTTPGTGSAPTAPGAPGTGSAPTTPTPPPGGGGGGH
jgi:hypothetical protein